MLIASHALTVSLSTPWFRLASPHEYMSSPHQRERVGNVGVTLFWWGRKFEGHSGELKEELTQMCIAHGACHEVVIGRYFVQYVMCL